jgi:hypothetical protein
MPKKQTYDHPRFQDFSRNPDVCTIGEQLTIPSYPPLWTKPVASLAHPDEDIPINDFCAKSLLDYEVSTPGHETSHPPR